MEPGFRIPTVHIVHFSSSRFHNNGAVPYLQNSLLINNIRLCVFFFLIHSRFSYPNLKWQIKKLDPVTRKVTTIAGTGRAGYKDGPGLAAQVS